MRLESLEREDLRRQQMWKRAAGDGAQALPGSRLPPEEHHLFVGRQRHPVLPELVADAQVAEARRPYMDPALHEALLAEVALGLQPVEHGVLGGDRVAGDHMG